MLASALLVAVLAVAGASVPARAAKPNPSHPAVQRALLHLTSDGATAARATAADSFEPTDLILDPDGSEHVRFDRRHKGLRVIGGDLIVHSDVHGRLRRISLTLARPVVADTTPALSSRDAAAFALQKFPHLQATLVRSELVIYARRSAPAPTLAWDVLIEGVRADGVPSRLHMLIDARAARLLDKWDDIHTAEAVGTGYSLYSGTVAIHSDNTGKNYELRDLSRGSHYVLTEGIRTNKIVKDADNVWGDGTMNDAATVAVDAAYGQNMTWDYFKFVLGRNGIDGEGRGSYSVVHANDWRNRFKDVDNAWWLDSCFCMHYGDGLTKFNATVSLDWAGHEMTHGVTSSTAKLIYSGESGGLNEATSDVFGTMVEFYANNSSDPPDYTLFEKTMKSGSGAARYMYQPSVDGSSADCWFPGVGGVDVHYSSGVANHFFYLLAEGTHPSGFPTSPVCLGSDKRVATGTGALRGIGRDKAAWIWYRLLTTELTSDSGFSDARNGSLLIAAQSFGESSAEYEAVAAAWSAVKVKPQWLNDTGITANQCYAAGSNALVSCASAEALALNDQQDGMVGRDVANNDDTDGHGGFSFTLVRKTKDSFYDKTECVMDKVTGLIWEGKTASGERAGSNVYTNYGDGRAGDASAYVAYVNSTKLCGFTNWRLPDPWQLHGLVDYSAQGSPMIDRVWFPNTTPGSYWWTPLSWALNADVAWVIGFDRGYVSYGRPRDTPDHVRLVR